VTVFLFRLTGFCKHKPTAVPLQLHLTATVFAACGRDAQPGLLSSYLNLTGAKRHLMEGSQLID